MTKFDLLQDDRPLGTVSLLGQSFWGTHTRCVCETEFKRVSLAVSHFSEARSRLLSLGARNAKDVQQTIWTCRQYKERERGPLFEIEKH